MSTDEVTQAAGTPLNVPALRRNVSEELVADVQELLARASDAEVEDDATDPTAPEEQVPDEEFEPLVEEDLGDPLHVGLSVTPVAGVGMDALQRGAGDAAAALVVDQPVAGSALTPVGSVGVGADAAVANSPPATGAAPRAEPPSRRNRPSVKHHLRRFVQYKVGFAHGAVSSLFGRDGFLVSGDALLVYVLTELQQDQSRVQTLPAVYAFELVLSALTLAGIQYRVFFVQDWESHLELPWALCRRVLVQHLSTVPGIAVDMLPTATPADVDCYCQRFPGGSFLLRLFNWQPFANSDRQLLQGWALALQLLLHHRRVACLDSRMTVVSGELYCSYLRPMFRLKPRQTAASLIRRLVRCAGTAPVVQLEPPTPSTFVAAAVRFCALSMQDQHGCIADNVLLAAAIASAISQCGNLERRVVPQDVLAPDAVEPPVVQALLLRYIASVVPFVGHIGGQPGGGSVVDIVDLRLVRFVLHQLRSEPIAPVGPDSCLDRRTIEHFQHIWNAVCNLAPAAVDIDTSVVHRVHLPLDSGAPAAGGEQELDSKDDGAGPVSICHVMPTEPTPAAIQRVESLSDDEDFGPVPTLIITPTETGTAADTASHGERALPEFFHAIEVAVPAFPPPTDLLHSVASVAEVARDRTWIRSPLALHSILRYQTSRQRDTYHWHNGRPIRGDELACLSKKYPWRTAKQQNRARNQFATWVKRRAESMIGAGSGILRPKVIVENHHRLTQPRSHTAIAAARQIDANNLRRLQQSLEERDRQLQLLSGLQPTGGSPIEKLLELLFVVSARPPSAKLLDQAWAVERLEMVALALSFNLKVVTHVLQCHRRLWVNRRTPSAAVDMFHAVCGLAADQFRVANELPEPKVVVQDAQRSLAQRMQECWADFEFDAPDSDFVQRLTNAPVNGTTNVCSVRAVLRGWPVHGIPVVGWNADLFQLVHGGAQLIRPQGLADPRTDFLPDAWQVALLDAVDAGNSALVVAPTSCGKTFISYYVMQKTLQANAEDLVLYIAPTKALMEQVYTEIFARFNKSVFSSGSASEMAGLFSVDGREALTNCQILVTLPNCANVLLWSAATTNLYLRKRLRYVILDEVHNILGEDAALWEKLFLSLPCPFVALSGSVHQPEELHRWLDTIARSQGSGAACTLVTCVDRWNDLSYFQWLPSVTSTDPDSLMPLTGALRLREHLQQLAGSGSSSISVSLLPCECALLHQLLVDHRAQLSASQQAQLGRIPTGEGGSSIPMTRSQALERRSALMQVLTDLSAVAAGVPVVEDICASLTRTSTTALCQLDSILAAMSTSDLLRLSMARLLKVLEERKMLPALLFELRTGMCRALLNAIVVHLEAREAALVGNRNKQREALLQKIAAAEHVAEKAARRTRREPDEPTDEGKNLSDLRAQLDALDLPHRDCVVWPGRHGTPTRSVLYQAFNCSSEWARRRLDEKIESRMEYRALLRGVGLHYAALGAPYRAAVEYLFRKEHLALVICTSTLAQGIHMPCRTVMFATDSEFLDATAFSQMQGRAGRRKFDTIGHVVFCCIPPLKTTFLLGSQPPVLCRGTSTSASDLVRLLLQYAPMPPKHTAHYDDRAYTRHVTRNLLQAGLAVHFNTAVRPANIAFMQFVLQFLSRHGMATTSGTPPNFDFKLTRLSHLVSHLYWTESSAFTFAALLRCGLLDDMISQAPNSETADYRLMSVLSFLFLREPLHPSLIYRQATFLTSKVFFDPMEELDPAIVAFVDGFSADTLALYLQHISTLAATPENRTHCFELPISGLAVGDAYCSQRLRSPFLALDGTYTFAHTLRSLQLNLASDLHVDISAVPVLPPASLLNRYLLDFYEHGQLSALSCDNGLSESHAFRQLQTFLNLLKVIYFALNANPDCTLETRVDGAAEAGDEEYHDDDGKDADAGESSQAGGTSTAAGSGSGPDRRPDPVVRSIERIFRKLNAAFSD